MKKIILSLFAASGVLAPSLMNAQSVTDAVKMYNYNRFESAKKILAPMIATNPEANYYMGLSEIGLGNIAAAKTLFGKFPEDLANQTGMARVLIIEKKNIEAMAILNAITKKVKKKEWLPYKYAADAITYTDGADFSKAVEWYKLALERNQNADLYTGMGDAYFYLPNGGGDAWKAWDNALANKPTSASDIYFRIGELWYSSRSYDSALVNFARVSELDPKNPLPYAKLANSYYKVNKFELAKQNMEKYLELSDKSIEDQYKYINILFLAKDYQKSVDKIKEIVAAGETKPYLFRLMGYSQYELGRYTEALASLDKFMAGQEKSKILSNDYDYYAKTLAKIPGNEARVGEYYQKALDADTASDKSAAYRSIADGYRTADNTKDAAIWYGKLIDNNAGNAELLDLYWGGYTNFVNKNLDQANKYFNLLATQYPAEPSGLYWLARVAGEKDENGKTGEAIEPYKKYMAMVGESNIEKKSELSRAYNYLIYYYHNKKDAKNVALFCGKQLAVNPGNEYATKMLKFYNQ
jgi:tetratricopeptide (TPR) repeat protein